MLKHLHIDNLAVIDNVELSFREGMTVLTGETGAGKSILIDALGLVLGDRADTTVIRTGCARAGISAMFDVGANEQLLQLLDEQSISIADNELLLRRTVNRDGPSRAYINTTAVPSATAARRRHSLLIDIHGQHEHQRLLKRDEQRDLLDGFGDYGDITLKVSRAYEKWDAVNRELRSLTEPDGETGDRISLLRYQVQELQALELEENEVERLEDEYKRLFNINTLLETAQQALDGLYEGEQSANDRINTAKRELASHWSGSIPDLADITGLLENATVHVAEAADGLRTYLAQRWNRTPPACTRWNSAWRQLHDIARKHRVQPQLLFSHFQSLQAKTCRCIGTESGTCLAELEQEQLTGTGRVPDCRRPPGRVPPQRCAALMAADISTAEFACWACLKQRISGST